MNLSWLTSNRVSLARRALGTPWTFALPVASLTPPVRTSGRVSVNAVCLRVCGGGVQEVHQELSAAEELLPVSCRPRQRLHVGFLSRWEPFLFFVLVFVCVCYG